MGKWIHRISNVDEATKTADCEECGRVDVFKRPSDVRWRCRTPERERSRKKRRDRKPSRRWSHLMGSSCQICGSESDLIADHDHDTDEFRGTLCKLCNSGIGFLGDSLDRLKQAVSYLERA